MDLRIFVAAPRSGSTLFMRVMGEHPDISVTSRNVLMGNMAERQTPSASRAFNPDYSIFDNPEHPVKIQAEARGARMIVSKEEYGNDRHTGTPELNECNFPVFPSNQEIMDARPVFTFRNPLHEFDSWLSKGWGDIDSFILAYKTLEDTYEHARSIRPDTVAYTYEYMVQDRQSQEVVFGAVCKDWGLKFVPEMLDFKSEFGANFVYRDAKEKEIYTKRNPKDIFTTLMNSDGIRNDVPSHGLLTDGHRQKISEVLMPIYNRVYAETTKKFANTRRNDVQGYGIK